MWDFPLFPEQASSIAERVDFVYFVLIALSGFFTLLVLVGIVFFAVKYRRGSTADRSNRIDTSATLEIGGAVFLLLLGLVVFVWAARVYVSMARVPETDDTLELYVLGKQWMWEVQHPEGRRELNHLHVPLGRTIKLKMSSQDVIHSFYIPAFRVKRDVLPGRYSTMWFRPTKEGTYHLFCAEYCGTEHSMMRGTVTVMQPDEYEEWLREGDQEGPLIPPVSTPGEVTPTRQNALARLGENHFNQLGCNQCHGASAGILAPSLQGIYGERHVMRDGEELLVDEQYLRESILYPSVKVREGYQAIMPAYQAQLTEQELLQLIEYIKFLGDPQNYSLGREAAPQTESE